MNSMTAPGGTSTRYTERDEEGESRGVFGRAYDLLFSEKDNDLIGSSHHNSYKDEI